MSFINLLPNTFTDKNDYPLPLNKNEKLDFVIDPDTLKLNPTGFQSIYQGDELDEFNHHALPNTKTTLLTFLFFSKENITSLQGLLRYYVHKEINYVIPDQSYPELLNVMREVFLDYNRHPDMVREDMTIHQKVILYKQYKNEVARLNDIVINILIPKIVGNISGYVYYLQDIQKVAVKSFNPTFTSTKGETNLRSITSVLAGQNVL
jgi:hypothetical protein